MRASTLNRARYVVVFAIPRLQKRSGGEHTRRAIKIGRGTQQSTSRTIESSTQTQHNTTATERTSNRNQTNNMATSFLGMKKSSSSGALNAMEGDGFEYSLGEKVENHVCSLDECLVIANQVNNVIILSC